MVGARIEDELLLPVPSGATGHESGANPESDDQYDEGEQECCHDPRALVSLGRTEPDVREGSGIREQCR